MLIAPEPRGPPFRVIFPRTTMNKSASVEHRCHSSLAAFGSIRQLIAGMCCVAGLVLLAGCATTARETDLRLDEGEVSASSLPEQSFKRSTGALDSTTKQLLQTPQGGGVWMPWLLPGKTYAAFESERGDGAPSITVRAKRSVSILRQRYPVGLADARSLAFTWRISALANGADLKTSEADDSPVRIVLAFEGDRSLLSPRAHRLSEMSRLLTGEEMPYATLAYVWSNTDPVGTIVVNRRSDRIRKVVVESGAAGLGQWRAYERDIQADFLAAFGEAPGPLVAVALMTDTDNTQSELQAWYGPLRLQVGAANATAGLRQP